MRRVVVKRLSHSGCQPYHGPPRPDQEKVIASGKHGIGIGELALATPGQLDREEGVHLARQRRHLGKGGRPETLLEDQA